MTNKTLLLNAANSILLGNQSGSAPTALNIASNIAAHTATTKNLVLGGSFVSGADGKFNDISGIITNNPTATTVTKIGSGTWQIDLAAADLWRGESRL